MTERREQKPIILLYHRIAERDSDPWTLAVTPDRFEEQLAVLRHTREPLSLITFLDLLESGNLPANAVAVTFDDGYVDNLRAAKPSLERAGVPASVFLATGYIGAGREFWWDELARMILAYDSRIDCEILVAGKAYTLRLRTLLTEDRAGAPWTDWQHPRTERERMYMQVWKLLRPLTGVERERALSMLRTALNSGPADPADLPMTAGEVRDLESGGLIEIGAHSDTHPILTALSPEERNREIAISKSRCEQLIGRSIQGFAYPHGACDDDVRRRVGEAGFRFACSTKARFVDANDFDALTLPRLKARDWGAEVFERALLALNGNDRKPARAAKSRS